ncbi:HNH endonuclease [Salmonella enterica]|nr:HNH endonuclease [Salmonella enterica]
MKEFLENYTIYEDGKIQRTNSDNNMCAPSYVGRFLTPETTKKGYQRVTLCRHGKTKRFQLHRLVALVHLPNPDNLPVVNHKDGNPQNNHVSNLEWCTYSHNLQHAYDVLHRDKQYGESRTWSKFTDEQIRYLRSLPIESMKDLADEWDCSYRHLRDIHKGKYWNHVI